MSTPRPYYLTTAIDYANGDPHLGHALEKIGADVIARWHRLRFPEARQRSFPQLKIAHLRRLPVPSVSPTLARRLAQVAERLAEAPSPAAERALRSLTLEAYGLAPDELPDC